jgi:hypothetical protein
MICLALGRRNLYETNSPVESPLGFFGRSDIVNTLLDAVSHVQHIGLFGLRKIGKTSLTWQLREQLPQHIMAYIDLQHLPQDCTYLYRTILEECIRDASFKYPDVKLLEFNPSALETAENQSVKFCQDLVRIWECLRTSRHDIKVILLLDGAEHLVPNQAENKDGFSGLHEFIGIIQSISRQYGFLVSMLVSSNPEISKINTWKGQSNPGFQYYKEVFLCSLSEDGCNQMISTIGAQMGLTYTEESLSRIYYETGGHPYVTRQLCSLIADTLKEQEGSDSWQSVESPDFADKLTTVQVKDVEDAVSKYIEYRRDYLKNAWQRRSQIEREILMTITTKDSCALEDFITNEHSYDVKRQRRKAISTLIENEIIEKCENKYSIRMGLFERFLLANH